VRRWGMSLLSAAVLCAAMVLASSDTVSADGHALEIFRDQAGPYEVTVSVQPVMPRVGPVHFLVTLTDAATALQANDAKVTILASHEPTQLAYWTRALNTPQSPQLYEANISFQAAGVWTLEVEVLTDGLGPATFSVPLEVDVLAITPATGGALVLLGVVVILVGGSAFIWYSARRQRRKGQA